MSRIHTACCALIASAVILGGVLLVSLGQRTAANEAHAAQVIARENFTLMTARTRNGEESLFVLDSSTGTLLVYRLDVGAKELELVQGRMLGELFGESNGRRRGRGDDRDAPRGRDRR